MILSAIAVIVTFGLVIFIHELGHFIACRQVGIRVEEFAFGFGPKIYGFEKNGTKYLINWIPLGGYVKPAGESIESGQKATDEYFSKPWYSRTIVAFAGPLMNYLLAFVLFAAVILAVGDPSPSNDPVIGDVAQGYPAAAAGLAAGDRIISIDGKPVTDWQSVADTIHAKTGALALVYRRGTQDFSVRLTPKIDSQKIGMIGVAPAMIYEKKGVGSAVSLAAHQCYFWTAFTIKTLASKIYHKEKPDVSGPIGIVQMVGKAAHSGMANMVFLIALLSVAVGLFNLFPIPILDGGQIMLFLWEAISRRRLTEKLVNGANSIGFAVLAFIFVFATYNDIVRIFAKPHQEVIKSEPVQQTAPANPAPAQKPKGK